MRRRTRKSVIEVERNNQILYADAPWSYNDKAHSGKRGVGYKYTPMTIDDIMALKVADIMADDAVAFTWVTPPLLKEGIATLEAWGFDYKTIGFVWVKKNRAQGDGDFMGMGNWVRANAELCLLGVRGSPKRVSASVHQVVRWMEENDPICIQRRIQEHSAKPPVVRDRIVQLMGSELKRTELFARDVCEGWHQYGHGIQGDTFDIRDYL